MSASGMRLVGTGLDGFSLLMTTGASGQEAAVERLGHTANGYFWETIANALVLEKAPELKAAFEFDCESSMFCAYGLDRDALICLQRLLEGVLQDSSELNRVIAVADRLGLKYDD